MKKKSYKIYSLNENEIIEKYLKKLNFNKNESYDFENDSAFLRTYKNHKIIVTNDSIIENVDFFKNDNPQSIAQKIITYNLSDLSAMGAIPYSYTLNLCIPKYLTIDWFKKFVNHLFKLQKKYNFFLLGGDLSQSKELMISCNFFGYAKDKNIITRKKTKINDDIWITGDLGESYAGLQIIKKKIFTNKKISNYFINKYYYPSSCNIGYKLSKYVHSSIDISDGFIFDLSKLLKTDFGALLNMEALPISKHMRQLLDKKKIDTKEIINCGDDYELIITAPKKNSKKILNLAMQNNIKISKVGRITKFEGIITNSGEKIVLNKMFKHFS